MADHSEIMNWERWTDAEIEYVRLHFPTSKPVEDIAHDLKRSYSGVAKMAYKLGLLRPLGSSYRQPVLTAAQRAVVFEHYETMLTDDLAAMIHTTPDRVRRCANRMGLRKQQARKPRPPDIVKLVAAELGYDIVRRSFKDVGRRLGLSRNTIAGIKRDIQRGKYPGISLP